MDTESCIQIKEEQLEFDDYPVQDTQMSSREVFVCAGIAPKLEIKEENNSEENFGDAKCSSAFIQNDFLKNSIPNCDSRRNATGEIIKCDDAIAGSSQGDLKHPWPHLIKFYGSVKTKKMYTEGNRVIYKGKFVCTQCKKVFSYDTKSTYGLKLHYKTKHLSMYNELCTAIEGGSRRGHSCSEDSETSSKKRRQICSQDSEISSKKRRHACSEDSDTSSKKCRHTCSEDSETSSKKHQATIFHYTNKFKESRALELLYKFLLNDNVPFHIVDSEFFAEFLSHLNSDFHLPSRRKVMRDLDVIYKTMKADLTNILSKVSYVATTADSWTGHNKSFLGMTVHWINKETLKREKALLACKEMSVSQTSNNQANNIMDIHQQFGIEHKVVCTTTDNGANFCAVEDQGEPDDKGEIEQLQISEMEDTPEEMVLMSDPDVVRTKPVEIENELEEHDDPGLPKHRRCISHTLNILAASDVSKVPQWSSSAKDPFNKTLAKAQALWNAQNRKTTTAVRIEEELGTKLTTPSATRWNSLYDSMKNLLKNLETHMTQINNIFMEQEHSLPVFNITDKEVITEYVEIMAPVAVRINMLLDEKTAYTGVLLPNLFLLKDDLEEMLGKVRKFKHGQNLVKYLLKQPKTSKGKTKGFEPRFNSLFDDLDLLIATALHPHFKLGVVHRLNEAKYQAVKDRILAEIKCDITENYTPPHQGTEIDLTQNDPFKKLKETSMQPTPLEDKLEQTLDSWAGINIHPNTPLTRNLFPCEYQEVWVNLFIKYNTPLASSAAVERMFSRGSDFLRPKRAAMASNNYEKFIFMKGNITLFTMLQNVTEDINN
ncbi:UNVERIFIED_CONTAM: hypothetical protein RMT77_015148 [Armadillidium vulgare]